MDKILQFLYRIYKKVRPPKRLYKYGTIGLSHYDDRTKTEKFWDYFDEFFFQWQQRLRYAKAYRKAVFNSFFDIGLGRVVSSTAEIKAKEKEGYIYMSDNELDKYSARRKYLNKKERKERAIKYFEEGFAKIRAGNSNYYEQYVNQIKRGNK